MAIGLTAFEKYLDSFRLNHPDFGDVRASPYAKGVITDFKKVSDDPIQVVSQVKVQIEGLSESDYIPIFYHPKAKFWDCVDFVLSSPPWVPGGGFGVVPNPGPPGNFVSNLAQTFQSNAAKAAVWTPGMTVAPKETTPDPGTQDAIITTPLADDYFTKAWMSFRVGDEVAVMLQEGTPVAVLGFADGVPRIGEILFKMNIAGTIINCTTAILPDTAIRASFGLFLQEAWPLWPWYLTGWSYGCDPTSPQDVNGPDGLPLNLVKECDIQILSTETPSSTINWTFLNWVYCQDPSNSNYTYWYDFWFKSVQQTTRYHCLATLTIGPIIYKIKFYIEVNQFTNSLWSNYLKDTQANYNDAAANYPWHQMGVPMPGNPGVYGYYWEPETPPPYFWYMFAHTG